MEEVRELPKMKLCVVAGSKKETYHFERHFFADLILEEPYFNEVSRMLISKEDEMSVREWLFKPTEGTICFLPVEGGIDETYFSTGSRTVPSRVKRGVLKSC